VRQSFVVPITCGFHARGMGYGVSDQMPSAMNHRAEVASMLRVWQ
jgi:hypothetical protein